MIKLVTDKGGVLLPVKIVPGASRTCYRGELDGRAKFAVAAPAEKGKANAALIAFLAGQLGLRRGDITVIQGATSPAKTLRIAGINADALRRFLTINTE